ncbi:hypothetical protein SAMN04488009_2766 [Maribacter sedimenticola]|uniref:Uncharacterized protein n=1 Tax=Maribacter sedimenticola TaxID=228956 RepID=A0ABY1SJH5_9FLAO|nr:hypothetical protein [Maribacter sedimenticola]SNR60390.1 hypothetical protein SAMN04488009_2766 [Maribacter sedimenticola]
MNFKEKYKPVSYSSLNSKQKENYNFHKVAATLADYGFNSLRLNDDWQGADFISVHVSGADILKIQLKARFTIDKKYIGKDLYIAFIEEGKVKLYYHDDAINMIPENIENSTSWIRDGLYTWGKTPVIYEPIISILN